METVNISGYEVDKEDAHYVDMVWRDRVEAIDDEENIGEYVYKKLVEYKVPKDVIKKIITCPERWFAFNKYYKKSIKVFLLYCEKENKWGEFVGLLDSMTSRDRQKNRMVMQKILYMDRNEMPGKTNDEYNYYVFVSEIQNRFQYDGEDSAMEILENMFAKIKYNQYW